MNQLHKKPILFLIFNRPEHTQKVFDAIKKYQPHELFIAADGPRSGMTDDVTLCESTRKVISNVDWDCKIHTLFREKNLGCKKSVSSAINWFFENVEEGIILEDDCVPNQSFFDFCSNMLETYREEERVMMISGTNFLVSENSVRESYFFSRYYSIWGWATWKRAWKYYDPGIKEWSGKKRDLKKLFQDKRISRYYSDMFNLIEKGFDTWDIQWWFTCIFHNGFAIVPMKNLISNIGNIGTHSDTQGAIGINMPTYEIDVLNLIHPKTISANNDMDKLIYKNSHVGIDIDIPQPGLFYRIFRKTK